MKKAQEDSAKKIEEAKKDAEKKLDKEREKASENSKKGNGKSCEEQATMAKMQADISSLKTTV